MPDNNTLVVSAPYNDDNLNNAGQIKAISGTEINGFKKVRHFMDRVNIYALVKKLIAADSNTISW